MAEITTPIDWPATKIKFNERYNQKGIAAGIPVNKVIFNRVLNGNYPFLHSRKAQLVVSKLAELGVLVELAAADQRAVETDQEQAA